MSGPFDSRHYGKLKTELAAMGVHPYSQELPLLPKLEKALQTDKPFLFVPDGEHKELAFHAFMARPDTMASLAHHGYKHLFIEMPDVIQPDIDRYAKGEIKRDEFIDTLRQKIHLNFQESPEAEYLGFSYRADMIRNAADQGIHIHAVDTNEVQTAPRSKLLSDYRNKAVASFKAQKEGRAPERDKPLAKYAGDFNSYTWAYYNNLPPAEKKVFWEAFRKERVESDSDIAHRMAVTAGGEKAAVFYGRAHMKAFEKELGADKIHEISLSTPRTRDPNGTAPIGDTLTGDTVDVSVGKGSKPLSAPAFGRSGAFSP